VPESNATTYPEPLRAPNLKRYNRRLGNHAGLENFGKYALDIESAMAYV
jgi:uncharacterized cupin superfamily protein